MQDDVNHNLRSDLIIGFSRQQKVLPPKYFYDDRGSRLFEEITRLPEYYLTDAESELLRELVPRLIAELRPYALSELGAGAASKTRIILDAMSDAECGKLYQPIDISADFLAESAAELRVDYPELQVEPIVADFTNGLPLDGALPGPHLYAFLGSTIGNLEPWEATRLLTGVRTVLEPSDRLLIGVDLIKSRVRLEDAYNDAAGVTAEFNLNLLRVLNREIGTDFDPTTFEHRALYDPEGERVEMHLVSRVRQRVRLPGAGSYGFIPGETIRTELSCKYDQHRVEILLDQARLRLEGWWVDDDSLFALALASPA